MIWARRLAEQEKPGAARKGGLPMVKTLHSAGGIRATTLVIFGWLSFVLSYVIENSFLLFVLQAVARVLPKSLMNSLCAPLRLKFKS